MSTDDRRGTPTRHDSVRFTFDRMRRAYCERHACVHVAISQPLEPVGMLFTRG